MSPTALRPTRVDIHLDAIEHNVRTLGAFVAPARVCAVVKADGYGHGSLDAARAALRGGASMLAVALVEEAIVLREGGVDTPILVLSEPPPGSAPTVVAQRLIATVYSAERIDELAAAARDAAAVLDVHLKIDTGMRRVGAAIDDVVTLAERVVACGSLHLAGTFTHFAVADAPDDPFTDVQTDRFLVALDALRNAGIDPGVVHASNSAGGIAHPRARFDMVRFGISIYGHAPDAAFDMHTYGISLQHAMTFRSAVSHVKVVRAGEGVSYGLRWTAPDDRIVATVPVGYADGVQRRSSSVGMEVLIRGSRRPVVGRVTMDQLLVDCGPAATTTVERGDDVVLIGTQGSEQITAWEWASKLDTIAYEITCGVSARVPRFAALASSAGSSSKRGPDQGLRQP